ncbi:hypothetical protein lerEdw1_003015 [Lerista edwardsae]|nr:hypothetical protein lerEdw1_003015 [Lerista edwardsae]
MEGGSLLGWGPPSAPAAEPEKQEALGLAQKVPDADPSAVGMEVPTPLGVSQRNGLPATSSGDTAQGESTASPPPHPHANPQGSGVPPACSVSSSSTCSSLAGSSPESDEVFSDPEEKRPPGKQRVLRKTKSWKTFFTMVHWSVRRRSSWVQLAGHEGNFKPSEGGHILKKFSAVEDACLAELMADVLRPFVPTYHGVVEVGGEHYIQMDDLLRGLDMPSIMDCKMGTRTYLEDELCQAQQRQKPRRDLYQKMVKVDPLAPTAEEHGTGTVTKPRYMQWRESISSSALLGFRIEGVTIEGGAVQKDFKQTRTKEQIVDIFLAFTKSHLGVLRTYLLRLEHMCAALGESAFFRTHEVIGSSLLFLHDRRGQASVWMIDFGKTLPAPAHLALHHDAAWARGNHEDGYLIGLRHLIETVRASLCRAGREQEGSPAQP